MRRSLFYPLHNVLHHVHPVCECAPHGASAAYSSRTSAPCDALQISLSRRPPTNSTQSLLDDIIDSINKLGWKAVDAVEAGLSLAPPESLGVHIEATDPDAAKKEAAIKLEIESGAHKLETLLGSTIDKNFDKLEVIALRSILHVPDEPPLEGLADWIRLSHYEGLNFIRSEDAPSVEEVREQRKRVVEAQRLQRLLMAEEARNAQIIAKLRALRGLRQKEKKRADKTEAEAEVKVKEEELPYPVFAHLAEKGNLDQGGASMPLSTTTRFALSQMPALNSLQSELQPMEAALDIRKESGGSVEEGEESKTWRRERVEYIEKQKRRHFESRGLELEENGEVRDGEWQGGGRKLGKGEVEELERVVGLMGGEREGKEEEKDVVMADVSS